MRFTFEGKEYKLSFERRHKHVTLLQGNRKVTVPSKYPYTTVTLYDRAPSGAPSVLASATVGCAPTDSYSNEKGRLFALKELTNALRRYRISKEFRTAMWHAYVNRGKNNLVIDAVATKVEEGRQLALPPAPEAETVN